MNTFTSNCFGVRSSEYFESHSEPRLMSRGCPFGIMGSSDECLGCHSVHPGLESHLKFRVCVPREGQLNFRAGDFDQAVPLFVRVFPTPSVIDTSTIPGELGLRMASLRASGRNRHPFTMRRTSVTELLARRQIVDIPQPETSLRPHLYHPRDIQNMARNRFTDERRTLPPRSFLNLFTVPVPLRPPRVPSQVVPSSPTPHLAPH